MSRTVSIEVVCDSDGDGGTETFGVVSDHRPDLPRPFNERLQSWVELSFEGQLEQGEAIKNAGEMEYEPNGEIIQIRKTS